MSGPEPNCVGPLQTYHYLFGCLLLMTIILLGYVLVPLSRKVSLVSGLILIPSAPFAAYLQNTYWAPVRVGGGTWGIEDVLFAFTSGTIVWWAAAWPITRRIRLEFSWTRVLAVVLVVHSISMSFFMLAITFQADAMMTLLFIHIAFTIYFYFRMPEYRVVQASGLVSFLCFYVLFLFLLNVMMENPFRVWESAGFWGVRIFRLPVGETLWACVFGTSQPVLAAYCCGARILPASSSR